MLNGTLTAVERTLTCILENYYDSEKNVLRIPEKLQKYVGKEEFKSIIWSNIYIIFCVIYIFKI